MYISIGIADLAGNAIIELLKNQQKPVVSFSKLEAYGLAVVEKLNEEIGEQVLLILSRNETHEFIHEYKDMFEIYEKENERYISLLTGKSIDDLERAFRSYMTWDMICAFLDSKALHVLGVLGV